MTTIELLNKLKYILSGLPLDKDRKKMLEDIQRELKRNIRNNTNNNVNYSAATSSSLGLVYQAETIAPLEESDDLETVISTVNTLIANLKAAGIIANS